MKKVNAYFDGALSEAYYFEMPLYNQGTNPGDISWFNMWSLDLFGCFISAIETNKITVEIKRQSLIKEYNLKMEQL